MNKSFDDEEESFDDDGEFIDIEATVQAIRAAWKCAPDMSLSQLLDTATTMPFCEMKNSELIDELNHFIHQNS
jgi:hypothetical protein